MGYIEGVCIYMETFYFQVKAPWVKYWVYTEDSAYFVPRYFLCKIVCLFVLKIFMYRFKPGSMEIC